MSATSVQFEEALLAACTPADHAALAAEVDVLVRRYAPDGQVGALEEAAEVLDEYAPMFDTGRTRVKLWAALLRRKARSPVNP